VTIRTSESTVTFRREFTLGSVDRPQPAGTYRIVMADEELPGVSFLAFRRVATYLHTPALSISGPKAEVFTITMNELTAALDDDQRTRRDADARHASA
jgi:hypothetical protein